MLNCDVALSYRKEIPADVVDDFINLVSMPNLRLTIEEREKDGPYAGLEWLLPTAVVVFICKSYFDGFLKEMGKEHYYLLKKSLKELCRKLLGSDGPRVFKITKGKISEPNDYSLVLSVMADFGGRKKIKLLIQQDASEQECKEIIDTFLDFLDNFYNIAPNIKLLEELEKGRGLLLVAFNRDTKTIEQVII